MILWALVGGFSLRADDPMPFQVTEVSLISNAEFAAMIVPQTAPDLAIEEPSILAPTPEVADDAPELPTPPIDDSNAFDPAEPDETPKPAPAPRVAPVSTPELAPDAEIADQITPEVAPEESADILAEVRPAGAPEQAASEIVTEAETPASAAPTASARPTARPSRPTTTAAKPPSDPTAAAVAAVESPIQPAPDAPTGPPLNQGERDSLRFAVRQCWVVDVGSIAANITVTIAFSLDKAGKVVPGSLNMLGSEGGEGRPVETAFEAARRAILRCQRGGYKLPSEKYSHWRDIEITFNPENMRIK